jgi:uncharacterized surface protein with fasciclin (FAS1) repeats
VQRNLKWKGVLGLFLALSLTAAACSDDDDDSATGDDTTSEETTGTTMESSDTSMDEGAAAAPVDSTEACDADAIVAAVEAGEEEGTLSGMTDDPVGTAASNNPVLTTLTTAVTEAGLVDTLNSAESLTVFAPTDCAFAALDPATLDAALADPTGLLTQVLGFHVVPGPQLDAAALAGETSLETFTGATLEVAPDGETLSLNGGQATVVVPDIQTANATVHLIDNVMLPPEDAAAPTTAGG